MAVSLTKGQRISLEKVVPGLSEVFVGLGWDVKSTDTAQTKQEAVRYDLVEDYSIETALILAELYRKDGEWRLNAVGAGYQGGLQSLLDRYS